MFCHLETDGFFQESTHGILFGTFLFGTECAFRRPMTNDDHLICPALLALHRHGRHNMFIDDLR